MNHIDPTHLAIGVFCILILIIVLYVRWRNRHQLIESVHAMLKGTINSFREIKLGDFYGLPDACKAKVDDHVGYTFYFACDSCLNLESISGILQIDLEEAGYLIKDIDPRPQVFAIRILLEKNASSYIVKIGQGDSQNPSENIFRVHAELNN
jgi:hypothetical protein